jgi:hypothetical protein
LKVPISMVTLDEFAIHGGYKAKDDSLVWYSGSLAQIWAFYSN